MIATTLTSPLLATAFTAAVVLTIGLLIVEHALVWRSQTHHLNMAFFTINGIISLLLGAAGLLDVILTLR